jgi:DNA-binding transcriptional ArsR family regulator
MSRRLRFHLSVDGLARTRLAHSPLWEAVFSLRAVADPAASGLHEPWAVAARSRLDGVDLDTLVALWTPCGAVPDFLTPLPASTRPRFGDELRRVWKTEPEQIKRDLSLTYGESLPAGLEKLYKKPGAGIDRLVQLLDAYWERALADHWPRLRHVLEGDLVYRTRSLAAGGTVAVFDDLHERVTWEHGDVVIGAADPPTEADHEVDVHDTGLLLLPSAFIWPFVATLFRSPSEPAVAYPSRGIGTLWQAEPAVGPQALAALIGRTRAGLLAMLDAPLSTSEIAHRSGLSIGGVSRHLAVLRESGLVTSQRRGHAIVHHPTPLGLSLLEADGEAPFAAAG